MEQAKFMEANPVLPVKDVLKAVKYYVEKLGFILLFQDSIDQP